MLPHPCLVVLPDPPRFTIVEANNAYARLCGVTAEALSGRGAFELLPAGAEGRDEALEKSVREGHPHSSAPQPWHPGQGNYQAQRWFRTRNIPLKGGGGEVAYILRSVEEVTDTVRYRHQARKARQGLLSHEKFLRETHRLAKAGSWEADLIHAQLSWSDSLREIFEVGGDFEPDFENALRFYPEGHSRDTVVQAFTQVIERGGVFDVELPILTAKGHERWLRSTGTAEIKGGVCTRIYGTAQDVTRRRRMERAILNSRDQLHTLVQSINGVVWEARADTLEVTFISEQVKPLLGYPPEDWLTTPGFWMDHIHPEDRQAVQKACQTAQNHVLDYRMIRADGSTVWIKDTVSVISEGGRPRWLRGIMVDVTASRRSDLLEHLEKSVLELSSRRETPLTQVFSEYLHGIQGLFPPMLCAIYRVARGRLHHWASPSLPAAYTAAFDNEPIGPNAGSCGTAAYLRRRVIVEDIDRDPRWDGYRDKALQFGLRACWSQPLMDTAGAVMGTFAIYYPYPKAPGDEELRVIDRANALLSLILENRRSAESLQEAALVMTQCQELAHFGSWQWELRSDEVSWSEALYQIYGLDKSRPAPTVDEYLAMVHEDDREKISILLEELLRERKDMEFEERIRRPDGTMRYLRSWARVECDESGEAVKVLGASLDITESRTIQEELRASETRLRSLVDAQTNYVIRMDLEGRFTYANKKYTDDYGDTPATLGAPDASVLPHHRKRLREVMRRCIGQPGTVRPVELDKRRRNGSVRSTFWHFVCLPDAEGRPSEIQCIGLDVTDRKEAEDALRLSNERYEYVNKATNDAIYDWDVRRDHVAWGEGYRRSFGHDPGQKPYPLRSWAELVHPDDYLLLKRRLDRVLLDPRQHTWHAEYRFRKASGDYAHVEATGYIIRDAEGRVTRIIGMIRDITERKLSEARLKSLHDELRNNLRILSATNAELEQFAYVASHDLQEPLRMISSFLTQLERKYDHLLDEKARKYIYFAVDGARRMRRIILDLLDYSRVGRTDDIREEVDVNDLLYEIVGLYRRQIEGKGARIEFRELPRIMTFRSPLRQVFQNLISNALKYQDGRSAPRVVITAEEQDTHWVFTVADNGIGIRPEYFEKIFIIFQRLHHKDEYSGTGMGLAITRKIVESLGGRIRVESQEGRGSRFIFSIAKNANGSYAENTHPAGRGQ